PLAAPLPLMQLLLNWCYPTRSPRVYKPPKANSITALQDKPFKNYGLCWSLDLGPLLQALAFVARTNWPAESGPHPVGLRAQVARPLLPVRAAGATRSYPPAPAPGPRPWCPRT